MKVLVVIPARLASTRLPDKPLVDILGKSMIQRTYEQCLKAVDKDSVVIATDHPRIRDHANELDMNVVMTSDRCLTGTDRVAEVAEVIDADYYINVQGDEPIIEPEDIIKVINSISEWPGSIINGYAPIHDENMYRSLTIPKVVFRSDGRLLYMSRSTIPGNKRGAFEYAYRQICIYAFSRKSLNTFKERGKKTPLEEVEDIEILRFLEMGFEVQMVELSDKSIAVDTEEDLAKVIKLINERK